jgi:ribosomal protein S18 acetylase RimI-like enzyme
LGLGTRLISELENRIKARGLNVATVGVEVENTRAKNLYEKLGYVAYSKDQESWHEINSKGKKFLYVADIILMNKSL